MPFGGGRSTSPLTLGKISIAQSKKFCSYLNGKDIYVRDAYAGAHPSYRLSVRVINEYPWSNQFAGNMFIQPSADELADFQSDWTVINAPGVFS